MDGISRFSIIFFSFFLVQDKKRIIRKKAEARKAELLAQGIDIHDQGNMLDEGDDDVLF